MQHFEPVMQQLVQQLARFGGQDEVFVRHEIEQLFLYTAVLGFALALCSIVASAFCCTFVERLELGQIFLWVPFNMVLLVYAFSGTNQLQGTVEERWFGTSEASSIFMRLYMGIQFTAIWAETAIALYQRDLRSKLPILLHHVCSILGYAGGIFFNRMHFYACLDGMCETTTVFLNILLLTKTNTTISKWMSANLDPLLKLNGVMLWLAFIVFRLVLFPGWLYLFGSDWFQLLSEQQKSKMSFFELIVYPAVNVLLLVLSSIWFLRIHSGMMKAMSAVKPKPAKEE